MKSKFAILSVLIVLALSILACGTSTPTPTQEIQTSEATVPPPVEQPSGDLEISQTYPFQDTWGNYYVTGILTNNTSQVVNNIELSIEIKDASGNSLLTDENDAVVPYLTFYPMLYTLAPGDSTPFQYYLSGDAGAADTYTVKVETFDTTSVDRGQAQAENVYVYYDGDGTIYLSGELVNQDNDWIYINGLAGGILDTSDTLVTADWTFTYSSALAPAGDPNGFDRTPFVLSMTAPDIEFGDWTLYWDVEAIDQPAQYDITISLVNNYFDNYGDFHIIGTVANNTDTYLTTRLVAGLYDSAGNVIDADYASLPIVLVPGEIGAPFDISYFSSVNWNDDVAAMLDTFTVQVDWYSTYEPYYDVVELETADDTYDQDGSTLTFTGNVTNTSTQNLSGMTVLLYIVDKDGNVVAVNSTYLWPEGDSIAPNATLPYEITIYGDPSVEFNADYTFFTYVQGDVD
jgi:hypothetical protein